MDPDLPRLKWQCRRGMRELDELLLRYLITHYESADAGEKQAFRAILQLPDPELAGYLLNRQSPALELQRVVDRILGRTIT